MLLTEDATKLKLFMDVLDGTKAAVRRPNVELGFQMRDCFSPCNLRLFPADHSHVRTLSPTWIHDGYAAPHPPQTLEEVSTSQVGGREVERFCLNQRRPLSV